MGRLTLRARPQIACDRGPKKVKHIRALLDELSLGATGKAYAVRGGPPFAAARLPHCSPPPPPGQMNAIKGCNPEQYCVAAASSAASPESGSKGGVLRTDCRRSAPRVVPAAELTAVEEAASARAQGRGEREARVRAVLGAATGKDGMRLAGFPPEQFDRVLLDPPCSALGLRPRIELVGRRRAGGKIRPHRSRPR